MQRLLAVLAVFVAVSARALDVSGYVYSGDGTPREGIAVSTALAKTVTGKDGAFVISGLPESVVQLDVDGRVSMFVLAGDAGITVTIEDPPEAMVARAQPRTRPTAARPATAPPQARGNGEISGVARINGKPLPGIPIIVQGIGEHRVVEPVQLVTNAKGEFRATGLAPMRYAVIADDRLSMRVRIPREPSIVDLTKERSATKTLDLIAAPVIRGRVVDAEEKPVARARVHLSPAQEAMPDHVMQAPARTAPDGRYTLFAPDAGEEQQSVVSVTAPRHSTVRSKPFSVGTADREVNITLPKLESVTVRVADRSGKAVADARVAFVASRDLVGPDLLEMAAQRAPRTYEAGELTLQLAPDSYDFLVLAPGFQNGTLTKRIANAGVVDVRLERAALIRGRVRRGDRGVPNVYVNVVTGRRAPRATATDEEGRFELDGLAPGAYRVTLHQPETMIERTVDVEAPADLDIALPPAGTLQGRVVDATTATPVREFVYSVEPVDGDPSRRRGGMGLHRGEMTEDGVFTVTVPVGAYRVSAGAQGYTPSDILEVRVTEEVPARVEIPLGRGVTVTGRVTDDTGLPLAEADVMIVGDELQRPTRRTSRVGPGHAKTAADGTFTITGIEPGEAQLNVRASGYVPHRRTLQAEGTVTVDVKLERGLSISGIVTRNGKPLPGAQVSAGTAAIGGEHQSAMTGDDGRFVLSGLVNARHTLSAYSEEQHAEVRDVDPSQRREITIALDPKPRATVFGTVTGLRSSTGAFVRRMVTVQGSEGGAEGPIDDMGNYRIENAPSGEVMLSAFVETSSREMRTSVQKHITLTAGQAQRVDLDLAGNVRVSGRITHEGKPVAGAMVGFSSENGTMAGAAAREDGMYEVALPAAGRYQIFARAEQFFDRHFSTVRDIRGGETIDIELREQVIEGTVIDASTRQPVAGALVTLTPMSATMMVSGEVPADANGRFRLVTTASGPQRLIASAPGYAHRVLAVGGAPTQYHFELEPAQELSVRVLDARTRAPLDAHLVVHEKDGTYLPGRPRRSTDGTTWLFSLAPGRYQLRVIVQGYAPRTVEVTAPGSIDVTVE